MTEPMIAQLLDEERLTLDEITITCAVSREWVVERVQAGVLLIEPDPDPSCWTFCSRDVRRARQLSRLERDFDANPELAGLTSDLLEELERLRIRLRRAGLSVD